MRIDKFLKVSRIMKRRTVANELASHERIQINGRIVKPSHEVKVNDEVSITFGNRKITVKVLSIAEVKRKQDATEMYEILKEEYIENKQEVLPKDDLRGI